MKYYNIQYKTHTRSIFVLYIYQYQYIPLVISNSAHVRFALTNTLVDLHPIVSLKAAQSNQSANKTSSTFVVTPSIESHMDHPNSHQILPRTHIWPFVAAGAIKIIHLTTHTHNTAHTNSIQSFSVTAIFTVRWDRLMVQMEVWGPHNTKRCRPFSFLLTLSEHHYWWVYLDKSPIFACICKRLTNQRSTKSNTFIAHLACKINRKSRCTPEILYRGLCAGGCHSCVRSARQDGKRSCVWGIQWFFYVRSSLKSKYIPNIRIDLCARRMLVPLSHKPIKCL